MLGTRFEDYGHLNGSLPFVFHCELNRTSYNCSKENNWHEDLEIQFCVKGSGRVLLDGTILDFSEGDTVAVNSNVIHYTTTDNALTYSCLIISSKFCKQIGINIPELIFTPHIKSDIIGELFRELGKIYTSEEADFRTAKLTSTVLKILIELAENHSVKQNGAVKSNKSFENVKATVRYVREHYSEKITLDAIAKSIYADKFELCRDFKKLSNQTIMQYANTYRCQKAADLIRDGYSINDAAWMCGFRNSSFFTKTFRQYIGVLPSKCKAGQ